MSCILSCLDHYDASLSSTNAEPGLEGAVEITGTPGLYALPPVAGPIRISASLPDGYVVYTSPVAMLHPGSGGVIRATERPAQALYSSRGEYAPLVTTSSSIKVARGTRWMGDR